VIASLLAASLALVQAAADDGLPAHVVDPTRSGPVPSPLQEGAPPLMDLFGATLSVSQDGAAVTAVAAPLATTLRSDRFLSDLRVQLEAGGAKDRWGGGLGFNVLSNIPGRLNLPLPVAKAAVDSCKKKVSDRRRLTAPIEARIQDVLALLPADEPDPRQRAADESLDSHGGRVVAAWKTHAAGLSGSDRAKGDALADELLRVLEAYRTAIGDCAAKGLWAARWDQVYDNGYFVRLRGSAHLFPHVEGPAVPVDGTLTDPTPELLADYSATVNVAYFPNPIFGLWVSGAYARSRASAQAKPFPERVTAGLDAAWNVLQGDRAQDGFLPGIAIGGYVRASRCLTSKGCGQTVTEYASPVQASRIQTYGAFVDVRASAKLQVRLAVPFDHYELASPVAGSDGKKNIWRVAPTLSLTVATWGG
jgi:hypothetical protein